MENIVLGAVLTNFSPQAFAVVGFMIPHTHDPTQWDKWLLGNLMSWKTHVMQLSVKAKQESPTILTKYGPVYSQTMHNYGEMGESVLPQKARNVQVDVQRDPQIPAQPETRDLARAKSYCFQWAAASRVEVFRPKLVNAQ